ncbi:hypothetical protein HK104_004792 [Borealophlyctis nickersoniae]|nr:hypothetical protein HK104_004792 [Borealophlyctis nickersoniae]
MSSPAFADPSQIMSAPSTSSTPSETPPHPERDSVRTILKSTGIMMAIGGAAGYTLAVFRKKKEMKLLWQWGMMMNWGMISFPYFTIREGLLWQTYNSNNKRGLSNFKYRRYEESVASALSGAITGTGLVWFARGFKYAMPGFFMGGTIGFLGQQAVRIFNQWRVQKSIEHDEMDAGVRPLPEPKWAQPRMPPMRDMSKPVGHRDPFAELVLSLRDRVKKLRDDKPWPEWASPLVNAYDVEYRKNLNIRKEVLEYQVKELRVDILDLRKKLGLPVTSTPQPI